MNIPVCIPSITDKEVEYVTKALKEGWISARSPYVDEFEKKFAEWVGTKYAVSTSSGTTALHLTLRVLDVGKGDEVIIPSFTMIATALAVVYCGARPVFVDADPETWCMDVSQIEDKITNKTKVILPVHIYGHPCDMDVINDIAHEHCLWVVEDAAEAHGAEYKGKKAGALSNIGCFSFFANKLISTGEGGMITTDSRYVYEHLQWLKDMAFNDHPALRFIHREIGYNYRMTTMQAALGLAQLERSDELINARRRNAKLYMELLDGIDGITLPVEKPYVKNVYWMFGILIDKDRFGISRDKLMEELSKRGIGTRPFFYPMHLQPCLRYLGLYDGERYPVAERLSRDGLYLPSSSDLTPEQIEYVVKAIKEVSK